MLFDILVMTYQCYLSYSYGIATLAPAILAILANLSAFDDVEAPMLDACPLESPKCQEDLVARGQSRHARQGSSTHHYHSLVWGNGA